MPAVVGVGKPETVKVDAAAGFTVNLDVPDMLPEVAVTVQMPDFEDA